MSRATVTTPAEWKEALEDGIRDFDIRTMIFRSPEDCIDVAKHIRTGNCLIMRGGGGLYASSTLLRDFDDGPPCVYFSKEEDNLRDWELRFSGLVFDGHWHSGQMLKIEWANQSLFDDVKFDYCGSNKNDSGIAPFDIRVPSSDFNFIQCTHNVNAGILRDSINVHWKSGLMQSNWAENGVNRSAGVTFIAPKPQPNCVPQILKLYEIHNEGCRVNVHDYERGVKFELGYNLGAEFNFHNVGALAWDSTAGSWVDSTMTWNGQKIDPLSPVVNELTDKVEQLTAEVERLKNRKLFGLFKI